MTRRKTSYLQGSGSPGSYLLPAEDHRLNRAALWTPAGSSGTPLRARGGVAPGNGAGVVTATAGGVNIAPGTAVVPGSVTGVQGVYECTWDAAEFRAATAASSSTYRQIMVVCHVYDSLNGDTKDDWDLEVVLGAGASTLATTVVPAIPANSVVLASGSVDPAGNVSVVPTGNAQVARGGILPVAVADTAAGSYTGQYRDHPTLGLQRWDGAAWGQPQPAGALLARVERKSTAGPVSQANTLVDFSGAASGVGSPTFTVAAPTRVQLQARGKFNSNTNGGAVRINLYLTSGPTPGIALANQTGLFDMIIVNSATGQTFAYECDTLLPAGTWTMSMGLQAPLGSQTATLVYETSGGGREAFSSTVLKAVALGNT